MVATVFSGVHPTIGRFQRDPPVIIHPYLRYGPLRIRVPYCVHTDDWMWDCEKNTPLLFIHESDSRDLKTILLLNSCIQMTCATSGHTPGLSSQAQILFTIRSNPAMEPLWDLCCAHPGHLPSIEL